MRNERRIARLERAVEARLPPPTCPACGGPRPGYNALVLVVDDDTPPPPRCPECGLYNALVLVVDDDTPPPPRCPECGLLVDEDGRARSAHPVPRDRSVTIRRIILRSAS